MLIDFEVSAALKFEGKATMLGELLEHMVEEADCGPHAKGHSCVKVHIDLDACLLGATRDPCAARDELLHEPRPTLSRRAMTPHG